jgi:hypothetical protein
MPSQRLDEYLKQLADALAARGASDARTIEEARAHLLDAVEAGLHRGLLRDAAEREAITAFGDPDVVAERAATERRQHHDVRLRPNLTRLLAAACCGTVLATVYLSFSVIVLHPPRFNYAAWLPLAGYFVLHSVVTLFVFAGSSHQRWTRRVLLGSSVAIASVGALWAYATASAPHFEGFALVLGSWIAIQGILTALFLMPIRGPWMIVRSN